MSIEPLNSTAINPTQPEHLEVQNQPNEPTFSEELSAFIQENKDTLFSLNEPEIDLGKFLSRYQITQSVAGEFQKTLDKVESLARAYSLIPTHAERSKENAKEALSLLLNHAVKALHKLKAQPEILDELDQDSAEALNTIKASLENIEKINFFNDSFFSVAMIANNSSQLSSLTLLAKVIDSGNKEATTEALESFIRQYVLLLKGVDFSLFEQAPLIEGISKGIDNFYAKLEEAQELPKPEVTESQDELAAPIEAQQD
jgi:hypothetical protein